MQLIHRLLDGDSLLLANDFPLKPRDWIQTYVLDKTKKSRRGETPLQVQWVLLHSGFECAFFLLSLLINTVLWLLIFGAVGRGAHEFFFFMFFYN